MGTGSSSGGGFSYDIGTQPGLTSLYNERITKAEHVSRPLSSGSGMGVTHSGVKVTTESGGSYLIHKGDGYGKSSETVVVDAKHMSDKWTTGAVNPNPSGTVGDLVKTGGANYGLLSDNCHHASGRMLKQTQK